MDLTEAFKSASTSLEGHTHFTAMKAFDSMVDGLESVKEKAKTGQGHGDVVAASLKAVADFQDTLQKTLDNASGELKPGEGCFAACASWYGNQVAAKLAKVKDDTLKLSEMLKSLAEEIKGLLKELSNALSTAMPAVTKEVKELVALPSELMRLAETLTDDPEAVDKIDMSPIEKSLDVTPINKPLDGLAAVKRDMHPAILKVKEGVEQLSDFPTRTKKRVQSAFVVIACMPKSVSEPPSMRALLDKLKVLDSLDLKPLVDMLNEINNSIKDLDVEKVRSTLTEFAAAGKEQTEPLTDMLKDAKQASAIGNVANQAGDLLGLGKVF